MLWPGLLFQEIYLLGLGLYLQNFQKRFSPDDERSGRDSEKMHFWKPSIWLWNSLRAENIWKNHLYQALDLPVHLQLTPKIEISSHPGALSRTLKNICLFRTWPFRTWRFVHLIETLIFLPKTWNFLNHHLKIENWFKNFGENWLLYDSAFLFWRKWPCS